MKYMKFKCPKCKKVINRDMRLSVNKQALTTRGYKSICGEFEQLVFMKIIK